MAIALLSYAALVLDGWLGTRTSLYGWAFYFGGIPETIETAVAERLRELRSLESLHQGSVTFVNAGIASVQRA